MSAITMGGGLQKSSRTDTGNPASSFISSLTHNLPSSGCARYVRSREGT